LSNKYLGVLCARNERMRTGNSGCSPSPVLNERVKRRKGLRKRMPNVNRSIKKEWNGRARKGERERERERVRERDMMERDEGGKMFPVG
jgi:hypothetical protein